MAILNSAIAAAHPASVMRQHVHLAGERLEIDDRSYDLSQHKRVIVLGAGKASAAMALTLEEIIGDQVTAGIVVTKYGHGTPCRRIKIREAGHPIVDANGLAATCEALALARDMDAGDLAIVLISGGGSALLESLPETVPLPDAQQTFDLLLRSGAAIDDMNVVRKHISQVKGGQLGRAIAPCPSITLIISDVIGDRLDVIASGPTVADPTTYAQAWDVINRFRLENAIPLSVAAHLKSGMLGEIPETPKTGDVVFTNAHHRIVASNSLSLAAAADCSRRLGYEAETVSSSFQGDVRATAEEVATMVKSRAEGFNRGDSPRCLMFGGETTVNVLGDGTGGRCQEFALAALQAMNGFSGEYLIAACGTDGTDGPTDAAGGIASPVIAANAHALRLSPAEYLAQNDSYRFLKQSDGLIVTGPTGTNVMDIYLALIPAAR